MKMLHLMLLVVSLAFAGSALIGCEEEKSPLEKAAQNAGDAMEDAAKAADKTGDQMKKDMEQATKELEEKAK